MIRYELEISKKNILVKYVRVKSKEETRFVTNQYGKGFNFHLRIL